VVEARNSNPTSLPMTDPYNVIGVWDSVCSVSAPHWSQRTGLDRFKNITQT